MMSNDEKGFWVFLVILSFLLGMLFTISLEMNFSNIFQPYYGKSTKVQMVKDGYAEWVLEPDGSTTWKKLKVKSIEVPQ